MTQQRRGIRIPISEASWNLIINALNYVVEKPHIDDLEEDREKLGKLVRYIERKLSEV